MLDLMIIDEVVKFEDLKKEAKEIQDLEKAAEITNFLTCPKSAK